MDQALAELLAEICTERPEVLAAALTRRAFLEEGRPGAVAAPAAHHERLETLGDAWLGAWVLHELFQRFPDASEAELTQGRTALVSNARLAVIAKRWRIDEDIRAGRGERDQDQHQTTSVLASHLEALVGAAACCGGPAAAGRLVRLLKDEHWPEVAADLVPQDYKSLLQQAVGSGAQPTWDHTRSGPEHEVMWTSTVRFADGESFDGEPAPRKVDADHHAARAALRARYPAMLRDFPFG